MSKQAKNSDSRIVESFDTLNPLVDGLYRDLAVLAGRKQDAPLSKVKISMINKVLRDAKALLEKEPTCSYLDLLDEEAIPNNADALLILGQYKSAMARFKAKYSSLDYMGTTQWEFKGRQSP
jgi:hypothetical protein